MRARLFRRRGSDDEGLQTEKNHLPPYRNRSVWASEAPKVVSPPEEEYVPLLPALSERHDLPQHPGPLMPLGEEGQVGERIDLLLDLDLYVIIARTCVGKRCCITCIICITRAYP